MVRKTRKVLRKVREPFAEFVHNEASGGIVLLLAAILALVVANSALAGMYDQFLHMHVGFRIGSLYIDKTIHHWINDGLMAIFFFQVGLEIKRELVAGELSTPQGAAFPMVAAIGGMAMPALLYTLLNIEGIGASGWGIPMATDIAFALGVMMLLGKRVPVQLKIFVTALAIVDDLGAVLVIALFYTEQIEFYYLLFAGIILLFLFIGNRFGMRKPVWYILPGFVLWFLVLKSGVHATVAGVLLAFTIPTGAKLNTDEFIDAMGRYLNRFVRTGDEDVTTLTPPQVHSVQALKLTCQQVEAPLQRLEHALHPWVVWLIMPLFAFVNAGVTFSGSFLETISHPIALGVMVGLFIGKPLGIVMLVKIAEALKLVKIPQGISFIHLLGAGMLAGIGFTMALFINSLAFSDAHLIDIAKTGILLASLLAGIVGALFLLLRKPDTSDEDLK